MNRIFLPWKKCSMYFLLRRRCDARIDDLRGNADGNCTWRHVGQHHRVRTDARAVADPNATQHLSPCPNDDIVLDDRPRGWSEVHIEFFRAERHALKDGDI